MFSSKIQDQISLQHILFTFNYYQMGWVLLLSVCICNFHYTPIYYQHIYVYFFSIVNRWINVFSPQKSKKKKLKNTNEKKKTMHFKLITEQIWCDLPLGLHIELIIICCIHHDIVACRINHCKCLCSYLEWAYMLIIRHR